MGFGGADPGQPPSKPLLFRRKPPWCRGGSFVNTFEGIIYRKGALFFERSYCRDRRFKTNTEEIKKPRVPVQIESRKCTQLSVLAFFQSRHFNQPVGHFDIGARNLCSSFPTGLPPLSGCFLCTVSLREFLQDWSCYPNSELLQLRAPRMIK